MNIIGIIPARYNSTRLIGKPLLQLKSKSMVQRVYENAKQAKSLKAVYIATDDKRIYNHAKNIGANVIMTSPEHQNGTSRCNEAVSLIQEGYDFIVNIQGDEPLLEASVIDALCNHAIKSNSDIATTISYIRDKTELLSKEEAKVVTRLDGYALYFSRSVIPYLQNTTIEEALNNNIYKKHLGLYIFKKEVLNFICSLKASFLSENESLEQLTWLEHGLKILTVIVNSCSIPVDTKEDVMKIIQILEARNIN
ncbi:MAG: 3-deoxy-manno-octulosonate cytidylyltransferase [Solitalea-like symbiont of Acarus siro]